MTDTRYIVKGIFISKNVNPVINAQFYLLKMHNLLLIIHLSTCHSKWYLFPYSYEFRHFKWSLSLKYNCFKVIELIGFFWNFCCISQDFKQMTSIMGLKFFPFLASLKCLGYFYSLTTLYYQLSIFLGSIVYLLINDLFQNVLHSFIDFYSSAVSFSKDIF